MNKLGKCIKGIFCLLFPSGAVERIESWSLRGEARSGWLCSAAATAIEPVVVKAGETVGEKYEELLNTQTESKSWFYHIDISL